MNGTLVFDGQHGDLPCFFKASPPPPPPPFDANAVPNNYLVSPIHFPQNDQSSLQTTQYLSTKLQPAAQFRPPPDACKVNPPGFVCGPLPAHNGELVKCVPRMDQSDLNQLSARVLPLSVSRANGALDDPARADPRFALFPKSYPAAFSRCCNGHMSDPLDIKPPQCSPTPQAEKLVADRIFTEQHKVKAMDLGFRKNPSQITQLRVSNSLLDAKKLDENQSIADREKLWKLESLKISCIHPSVLVRYMRRSDFL
jgi:hypothetical protein